MAIAERNITRNASIQVRYRIRDEDGAPGGVIPLSSSAGGGEVANDDFLTMLYVHF